MNQGLKSNRKRGVILTSQGREKLQRARQKAENQENFGVKYTFEELSDRTRLTPRTVARAFEGKTKVDKLSLEQIFRAFSLELVEGDYYNPQPNFEELEQEISNNYQDWGEAVDVSFFYGRAEELAELKQWILKERCRLVGLFGIGGIGKTSLSVKLAEQLQDKFEYVIWRSLRCAPPINKVLAKFIQFVSNEQETEADLPGDLDSQVLILIGYLRASRCLLVLDNAETIMQHGDLAGRYRQGYEGYGELIRRIGEVAHQSCLVLTSREKPQDFVVLEGETLPVRSLQLHGLPESESREILRAKGFFSGSDEDWKILIQRYAGNPLALKIMATTIQELVEGDISEFLKQSPTVVGSLRDLLEQQFERLSDLEKEVMYWLAINRENATLAKLREDILSPGAKSKLLESLEGLGRRSLIEKCTKSFTLQTIVMEYLTDHLIERICQEIEGFKTESSEQPANLPEEKSLTLQLLRSHALIKPLGKDYVRDAQIRCILEPIADQLLTQLESKKTIQNQLNQILATLRGKSYQWIGYAGGNIFNLLCQIQTDLRGYNFSHLTLWQADFRKVNLHQATLAYSDLSKSVFDQAIGSILAVAFSPNGKLLAIGDFNNRICLWRVADGKQLVTCQGHTGWVVSVAFSPDSRTLASGSADNTVKLWDIQGHCLKTWQEHTKAIQSVAFSPQGQILASGSDDQTIRLWDTSTGECLKILPGHTQPVRAIAFKPQGQILASGSDDQTIRLWDTITGECLKISQGHTQPVRAIAFSPQGELLVSGSEDCSMRMWDAYTGECRQILLGHTQSVLSVAFAWQSCAVIKAMPKGYIFASGSHDKTVRLWDAGTGQCLGTLSGHTNSVRAVAFSPESPILASGGEDQALRVWDITTGQCRKTLQGYTNPVWSVAFNPNGSLLASGSEDHTVKLWDVNTGRCCQILRGHSSAVRSVAFSPDGTTLASGSEDHTVKLWDVSTGRCRKTLRGDGNRVWSIAFSPDGSTLASGHENHTVKLWDFETGQYLTILKGHNRDVASVAYGPSTSYANCPDSCLLASASRDRSLRLWDGKTGECLKVLQGHSDVVWCLSYSPDGRQLASASRDRTVKLWDVATGECLKTLAEHRNGLWCNAFSPDGRTLASGGNDWVVRLWDVATGQSLKTLEGHTECVRAIAFSPDSKILATSSDDETIRLWNFLTSECLLILRSERAYEGMNITGTTGLTEATISTLLALGAVENQQIGRWPEFTA